MNDGRVLLHPKPSSIRTCENVYDQNTHTKKNINVLFSRKNEFSYLTTKTFYKKAWETKTLFGQKQHKFDFQKHWKQINIIFELFKISAIGINRYKASGISGLFNTEDHGAITLVK